LKALFIGGITWGIPKLVTQKNRKSVQIH